MNKISLPRLVGGLWVASCLLSRPLCAAPVDDTAACITPPATAAVTRGLDFLASRQQEDGSFGTSGYARNVGVCSLVGLAFVAHGSTPTRGKYAAQISGCLDYLLAQADATGFLMAADASSRGPMYGHGFATLLLAEVYGMARQPQLRDRLGQAVDIILAAQNEAGGWRYQPTAQDADLSVTACQVMALRAARNAGIAVPRGAIERAVAYIKSCQNPDGGFRYMLEQNTDSQFARSAAAVVALYNAGIYAGEELDSGLDYVAGFAPGNQRPGAEAYFFYAHYYAAQAMWHAGGDRFQQWFPAVRDDFIRRQDSRGAWQDAICSEYGTAMACIVLQIPENYLPILQR